MSVITASSLEYKCSAVIVPLALILPEAVTWPIPEPEACILPATTNSRSAPLKIVQRSLFSYNSKSLSGFNWISTSAKICNDSFPPEFALIKVSGLSNIIDVIWGK